MSAGKRKPPKNIGDIPICSPSQGYLFPDEEKALAMMREIKAEISEMKKRLAQAAPDSEEAETIRAAMEKTKAAWKTWETRRNEAHRAKMVSLGHQQDAE